MSVVIVFATIEGQTEKIVRFIEREVRNAGQEVAVVQVLEEGQSLSFDAADSVILAAPVHERRHPKAFEVMLASQRAELDEKKTLLISVSLRAAFKKGQEEAQDYIDELKMRTRFTPDMEALVAGAVRARSYDYFQTQVLRHVVLRDQDYDPTEGEHEFTDWSQLSSTVKAFLASTP